MPKKNVAIPVNSMAGKFGAVLLLKKITVKGLHLSSGYPELPEDITPAKPLALNKETFSIINAVVSLCIKFSERKNDKLYYLLLKDSCNALAALVISQYFSPDRMVKK